MPGLIAFRRRWATGSDDLVIPGFILFCIHIILFVLIAILISTSRELDDLTSYDLEYLKEAVPKNESLINRVECATEIRNFCIGYLVLIAVASVIQLVLTCFSMKGTILDPAPRRPVEYIFYIRIGFGAIEIAFSIMVCVITATHWSQCDVVQNLNKLLIGIVAVNILVFVIVLLVGCCVFDPAGGLYYKAKSAVDRQSTSRSAMEQMRNDFYEKSRKTWLSRLSSCFCCVSNNQSNMKQVTLDEVSNLLHNFFKDYDFVLSDIVAGLTLLRHKQQCIETTAAQSECWCRQQAVSNEDNDIQEFMSGRPITPHTHFIDFSNQKIKGECEDLAYYCTYALAAYGPLFFWVENTATGMCQILKECMCVKNPTFTSPCCMRHRISRNRKAIIRSDSGCGFVHAAIRKSLIEHGVCAEIVYVSLENELYQQPFYLSVDHGRRAVIVAIRGTLGDEDALTDLVANAELIESPENDGTWKAHKGMLRGAEFIKNKLLHEDMVLSLGFGHCLAKGTRNYDLIILGHSLGAGVASILAILLHTVYPNLRCYAFSPPGGLLSHSAMLASKEYIHTLILGKDVVPRMGIPQLESLRNEVVDLLKHTSLPKYKIILSNVCGSLDQKHKLLRHENLSDRAVHNSLIMNSSSSELASATISEPLYLPGLIHHLIYSKEVVPGCRSSIRKKYYIVYGDNMSDFSQIIVSHQMISHHFPQEVWKCMNEAVNNYPSDRNFGSTYAHAETLPFKDKKSSVPQRLSSYEATSFVEHGTLPNRIENVNGECSSAGSISTQPISINVGPTEIVAAEITTVSTSSSSSDFSLLSIPDTTAPLARPESFSLSSSARSPTSPFSSNAFLQHRQMDVVPNEQGRMSTDALLTTEPQESSSRISTSKALALRLSTSDSFGSMSFSLESWNQAFYGAPELLKNDTISENDSSEISDLVLSKRTFPKRSLLYKILGEQYDSNLSCDDVNVDIHGTNAVG